MKQCMFCAEQIQPAALLCRYCGGNQAAVAALAARRELNWKSVFSLVMGVVWLWGIGSLLAVIYGNLAQKEIDEAAGGQGGRALATWAIVLGWIGVAVTMLVLLAIMFRFTGDVFLEIVE